MFKIKITIILFYIVILIIIVARSIMDIIKLYESKKPYPPSM